MYLKNNGIPERLASKFPRVFDILYNKYYVDEIYDFLFVTPIRRMSEKILWKMVDARIIDDGLVNGTARFFRASARRLRRLQAGDVQSYAVGMAVGVLAIIGFLLLK